MTRVTKTLYDKVFDHHVVSELNHPTCLLYIDRHLVHEVTSPQAFEALRTANRPVRRPDCTLATVDHNTPTSSRAAYKNVASFVKEPDSRVQCITLEDNVAEFGLTYFGLDDRRQGIVHVIGPEQGFTLPGTTVVCGDSHTSTHGAFGALAFGIGTSEVEHVLATQTLLQKKAKNMLVSVNGSLPDSVTSKDVVLHIIGLIGTAGGTGYVIEFAGSVVENFSMEARMSVCNMAIEAGARAGMIAPDRVTFEYLKDRPLAPRGEIWDRAVRYWSSLKSDEDAVYDKVVVIDGKDIAPTVTWGTSPQDVVPITGNTPDPALIADPSRKAAIERSLNYMGLSPNQPMESVKIDKVFIGSCTNSRIEDLQAAAAVVLASGGKKVAEDVYAMIVPGSGLVKIQAEQEGLDKIFKSAGFDWREAGCSMCLGMNPDQLRPGERCASTSNRNFEGRQGPGGRTHLVSPAMAAAAAIAGHLTDVRKLTTGNSSTIAEARRQISIGATDSKSYLKDCVAKPLPAPKVSTTSVAKTINSTDVAQSSSLAFTVLEGIPAPLAMNNVDTDMIIPKQFLKTIKRTGLGKALFYELRYDADGNPLPTFVLNQSPYNNSSILISGENFGCGSSREHAPWALRDFGITCIIAPSFADIFFNNCFKNGMLPIALPASEVSKLLEHAKCHPGSPLRVDLPNQTITVGTESVAFEIEEFRKHCLVNGLDDIGLTMQKSDAITLFEDERSREFPWLDGVGYAGRVVVPVLSEGSKKAELDW